MSTPLSPAELAQIFGTPDDPIARVVERAKAALQDEAVIWEGDAATFEFTYVSEAAEKLLGWPRERWTSEPTFWADVVIFADDKPDAVAYCALATAKRRDHVFDYRAMARDGRVLWLRDYVRVILGARGIPIRLRGLMLDISEEKRSQGTYDDPPGDETRSPTLATLND